MFNSQLNVCQKGSQPCSKIDCSKATAAKPYVVYASNKAYYAYCSNNGGVMQPIMFKCALDLYQVFDLTVNDCIYNCKAKGNFQDPENCNQYYYCSGVSAKPTLLKCPTNYVFNGTGCDKDETKCQNPPPAAETAVASA